MSLQTVKLASATYYGKELTGEFPLIRVTDGDKYSSRDVYVTIVRDNKQITVQAYRKDIEYVGVTSGSPALENLTEVEPELSDEELGAIIKKRFKVMSSLTDAVIAGNVRSLIIAGAPGVGKTFELEGKLQAAETSGAIASYTHLGGKITGLALYAQLWESRHPGSVLVLDDIDVFQDEDMINLLKKALDTGTRRVNWLSSARWLEEQEIDSEFEFEGTIVFISNTNFDAIIKRGGGLAKHLEALIDRSLYLNLKVHTKREIMIRIEQIVTSTNILDANGLTLAQGQELLSWLKVNQNELRDLSLRTLVKLSALMISEGSDWIDIAEVTQLR